MISVKTGIVRANGRWTPARTVCLREKTARTSVMLTRPEKRRRWTIG